MEARKARINEIINSTTLVEVPFFQRSYVWKEELWQRLLDDVLCIMESGRPHFFGSIILKAGRERQPNDQFSVRKTIVDGQQRLTTFLIFMKVLCLKQNQPDVINVQFTLMGKKLALSHGKNDINEFEKVMASTAAEPIENYHKTSRIIEAYNFFVREIDPSKFNIMTILANAQFVLIDLEKEEDEQQIFDSINSLGVNLTTSELLKNYFFNRYSLHEYEEKWEAVFEKDEETKSYWDTELEVGRFSRAIIDIFFNAYFELFVQDRNYNISNEDKQRYGKLENLSQSYQHFIKNYCKGNKNIILNNLREYALCFKKTFRLDQCERSVSSEFGVDRINVLIFGLKNTTLIPYILYLAKNVSDENELNKILGILESFVMRRMIVRAPTKNYNKLFTSLILNRVLDAETLKKRLKEENLESTTSVPKDEDIYAGFQNSWLVNLQAKGIIYLMESKIRPSNSAVALLGFNQYSLEHLMPKKWRNNWAPCATEDEAKQRDTAVLTLGNLAIITQSLNASIRDAAWNIKKAGKGNGKPGLDLCAGGLSTLHEALTKTDWNEEEISARAKWLAEKAITIWKI